jgi:hypothetical protein
VQIRRLALAGVPTVAIFSQRLRGWLDQKKRSGVITFLALVDCDGK